MACSVCLPGMFTETSASRLLQGCKYMSSHTCSPTYLSGRDCCKAAHLLLDSPAFRSCFMSLLQNNLYFNIFLMSTSVLICCREEKFPPAMFCSQKHTCTAQHLLSDLFHGYSPRPRFRQQLFSKTFIQSMTKSNKLGDKHLNASLNCNKAHQRLWHGHDSHHT